MPRNRMHQEPELREPIWNRRAWFQEALTLGEQDLHNRTGFVQQEKVLE
jgi:hypothetical protein